MCALLFCHCRRVQLALQDTAELLATAKKMVEHPGVTPEQLRQLADECCDGASRLVVVIIISMLVSTLLCRWPVSAAQP